MSLLVALIIGIVGGAGVGFWLHRSFDFLLMDTILGCAGSILGLVVYFIFLSGDGGVSLVSLPSMLCSSIFALIFVLSFNALQKILPTPAAPPPTIEQEPSDEK